MEPPQPHALPTNALQMGFPSGLQEKYNDSRSLLTETDRWKGLSQRSQKENKNSSEVHFNSVASPATSRARSQPRRATVGLGSRALKPSCDPLTHAAARGLLGSHTAFEIFELALNI